MAIGIPLEIQQERRIKRRLRKRKIYLKNLTLWPSWLPRETVRQKKIVAVHIKIVKMRATQPRVENRDFERNLLDSFHSWSGIHEILLSNGGGSASYTASRRT
jgi:hypothetical protein